MGIPQVTQDIERYARFGHMIFGANPWFGAGTSLNKVADAPRTGEVGITRALTLVSREV